MITLEEFRKMYLNEEIIAPANINSRYPHDVFIESAYDILHNDFSLLDSLTICYLKQGRMQIDAGALELETNTVNLMYADYNPEECSTLTNTVLSTKCRLLMNFFENAVKGRFKGSELANPANQLACDIKQNIDYIGRIHLFVISTNKLSSAIKELKIDDYQFGERTIKVQLDVLDINKIYKSRMVGFEKEDVTINCSDYGIEGIPCIKADIQTDQYDSYLAIVPGKFLSDIYIKYGSVLLESNVRSFLKFNGYVNKGIRGTILNEKSRFFTYNNGISTTAKSITVQDSPAGTIIKSFTNLQIINGGQTTATLASTSIKNKADLSGIFVQMKLTVLKDSDPELIRNIANYANSQNKVKTADLNSGHPFYVRIEDLSRKTYAPLASGQIIQTLWYFERVRGQYEQPLMQMTKKQIDDYKTIRPRNKKYTLMDLAKYENCAAALPHFVSWGGEVNAAHFHDIMAAQWEKDKSVYNELYYKELIGMKILYDHIGKLISDQQWYQEKRAYRPQLIAYTFAKLVLEAKKRDKFIDYKYIWDLQDIPASLDEELKKISKLVFDVIYDDNRPTANIETYCKREQCWTKISTTGYSIDSDLGTLLISRSEKEIENTISKKEQQFASEIEDELGIFQKGKAYWENLIARGKTQNVLNGAEIIVLNNAIKYCMLEYESLTSKQIKDIISVMKKLKENGIE